MLGMQRLYFAYCFTIYGIYVRHYLIQALRRVPPREGKFNIVFIPNFLPLKTLRNNQNTTNSKSSLRMQMGDNLAHRNVAMCMTGTKFARVWNLIICIRLARNK
jgi:hypothetical protein